MSKVFYAPISHFFVDCNNITLSLPSDTNYKADAFGPIPENTPNSSSQYRVTSKIRGTGKIPVFAIANGQVLIQPMSTDNTKINIIIKPHSSFAPLKIKYFVYRGLDKSDLMEEVSNQLQLKDASNPLTPDLLKKLWEKFLTFNEPPPSQTPVFPTSLIGYESSTLSDDTLLDDIFCTIPAMGLADYVIPECRKGEHIGYFTGEIGLDIVLDHGDYQLEEEEELFKIDLAYARKSEQIFDIATLANADKQKSYKEHIHQFLDPAAFYGSHIDCGRIEVYNDTPKKDAIDIYSKIVSYFQTKNKIYLYVKSERDRSYNFYGDYPTGNIDFSLDGSSPPLEPYSTNGWPILIKEFNQTTGAPIEKLKLSLEFDIETTIHETDRNISIYSIIPDREADNFIIDKRLRVPKSKRTGQCTSMNILPLKNFTDSGTAYSISSFFSFYISGLQKLSFTNYYDDLWTANIKPIYNIPSTPNLCQWISNLNNKLTNLSPILGFNNTLIHQKVIFDNGKNSAGDRKNRRLYIANIVDTINDNHEEYNKLIVKGVTSGFEKNLTQSNYSRSIYNNMNIDVYKGQIKDGFKTIDCLSLRCDTDYLLKNSFFQLGITEEEYNKLMYDSSTKPATIPATSHLPKDSVNIKFHLEEDTSINLSKDFRKFKLGLLFENDKGELQSPLFPSNSNKIWIYTIDEYYYFSKEFAEYQEFFEEFAKAKVEFRTLSSYNGEFGFDWLRIGDNGEFSYESTIITGFERHSIGDSSNHFYENKKEAMKALKREYQRIPTQNKNDFYYIPYLNIYSKPTSDKFSITPPPPYEIELKVFVEIEEDIDKLEFEYDANYFILDKPKLTDKNRTSKRVSLDSKIKITCLKDLPDNKYVKIWAYPIGWKHKKEAKLAGQIIILKNSLLNRKEIDFVLVKVITDIDNDGITNSGEFSLAERNNLINSLYQIILSFNIENGPDLNLCKDEDKDYKIISSSSGTDYGKFIYKNVGVGDTNIDGNLWAMKSVELIPGDSNSNVNLFYRDLINKYIDLNPKYKNYFTVFAFSEAAAEIEGQILGAVEDINIYNVCLFTPSTGRGTTTLNHEVYHGLGLYHTHQNNDIKPDAKYIYPKAPAIGITDNIMSYNSNAITSWFWQWKIVRKKLKK